MAKADELALEHAWRYFALHSEQRTTVFNFFVASAGLTLSALAYVLANDTAPKLFGVGAGIGVCLLALVFWKLDQRVAQLTKCAEQILIDIEQGAMPEAQRTFSLAEDLPVNSSYQPLNGAWSYGRSFRFLFAIIALLGVLGAAAAAMMHRQKNEVQQHTQQVLPRPRAETVKPAVQGARCIANRAPRPLDAAAKVKCPSNLARGTSCIDSLPGGSQPKQPGQN